MTQRLPAYVGSFTAAGLQANGCLAFENSGPTGGQTYLVRDANIVSKSATITLKKV